MNNEDIFPRQWLKFSFIILFIFSVFTIPTLLSDYFVGLQKIVFSLVVIYCSGIIHTIPMYLAKKLQLTYKKFIYFAAATSALIALCGSFFSYDPSLEISVKILLATVIATIIPICIFTLKKISLYCIKYFTPKNTGVKRLCLVAGFLGDILLSTTEWKCHYHYSCNFFEHFELYSILYLALAFCTPFILAKIIEYIADGFRQEQEIL